MAKQEIIESEGEKAMRAKNKDGEKTSVNINKLAIKGDCYSVAT